MIIDNKGKLFGKVSIVDLLIVVILIAGLLGAYYKFGRHDSTGIIGKTQKVTMTFFQEDIQGYVADDIKVGDIVKDRQNSVVLGKVTDVKIGADIMFYPNSDGKVTQSSKPGYVSIQITVEGQGDLSNTGATFSNVDYYVNKQFELRVGISNLYPRISSIK